MAAPRIPEKLAIKAEPQDTIPITLVGKDYNVRQPKGWLSMRMGMIAKDDAAGADKMMEVLEQWISAVFGRSATAVVKRLDDPKDELDIEHIMELVEAMAEKAANGRPTS